MHPSIQTTYNDLAQALTGLKASAPKPVRETTRQKRVMQLAWSMYREKQAAELKDIELYRAEATPEQFKSWIKRNTTFNAKQFAKVGIIVTIVGYLLMLLMGMTYWRWLGWL